jgi:hypothetical protein
MLATTATSIGQSSTVYQLPGGSQEQQQQLHNEIKKAKSIAEIQRVVNSRLPPTKGELMILFDPQGGEPFFWILDEKRKAVELHVKMAQKAEPELHSVNDLGKIYFTDTLIIIDTLLIDLARAKEVRDYDSTKFYFQVKSPKPVEGKDNAGKMSNKYKIPLNQYQKLLFKRNVFENLPGDFFAVELYHENHPDKLLAKSAIFFPSAETKARLLRNAIFLKSNGYTLPDITSVVSMDLDRFGHVSYRLLLNWLQSNLKNSK